MYSKKRSFGEKVGDWFRDVLSCCDREEEEEARPALHISGPTNFRREDITLPGLDPEQQDFIRTKAISDAQKLYANLQPLQPLRSSPSGHFASPTSPKMPTYEEFTTPRSQATATMTPTPPLRVSHPSPLDSTLEKVKRHSRRISTSFSKAPTFGGYQPVGGDKAPPREAKYEMQGLMDDTSRDQGMGHKHSGESFSVGGSELEEFDKGVLEAVDVGGRARNSGKEEDGDSAKVVKF